MSITAKNETTYICFGCEKILPLIDPKKPHIGNYGKDDKGNRFCFACCGKRDLEQIKNEDRITLYLTMPTHGARMNGQIKFFDGKVSNWPGSLSIHATGRVGNHNIAGNRYDIWFTDPFGIKWHGVQYGDMTQLVHCRKLKGKQ